MLNDNEHIENNKTDIISPLIKKIMKFNSILSISSIIITQIFMINKFYLHFRAEPVSVTQRGKTIQEGFQETFQHIFQVSGEGILLIFFLVCFCYCFINYGILTFLYLNGRRDLLDESIKFGFFCFGIACIECFFIFSLYYDTLMLELSLSIMLFLPVLINLIQLIKAEKKNN